MMLVAALAIAAAKPPHLLWAGGRDAILDAPCRPGPERDALCRAIAWRRGARTILVGDGYLTIRLLWRRRDGGRGPDALVLGDSGGSGGYGELFALRGGPRPIVRRIAGERMDTVVVQPAPIVVDLPFDLEFFNDAPHAGAIVARLPVRWAGTDWALARAALLRRLPADDLAFRELAVREELSVWAHDERTPPGPLYPHPPDARGGTQVTGQALVELILAGHADAAHRLLYRAWPRDDRGGLRGGAGAFWRDLCRAVIGQPLWRRFGLGHLPRAALVEAAAH